MAPSTASGLRQRGDEAARAIGAGGPQVAAQYGAVHASTARAMSALTGKGRQSVYRRYRRRETKTGGRS